MSADNFHTEKDLLLQVSEGDESAFREIFHLYGDVVHASLFPIVKSSEVAKDLVQETFLRVWIYRDKLPKIDNFRSWLLRIGYNRAFSHLRDTITHQKSTDQHIEKYGLNELDHATEDAVHLSQLTNIIKQVVAKLPPQQKKIYLLSREHGLKIPEIAEQLGLSVSTVKNTLGRALQALREAIEKAGLAILLAVSPWLL